MKKNLLKTTLVTAIAIITTGICSSSVTAETTRQTTYTMTDGGQKITITARGYTDLFEPVGGVHVRTYGVSAYTPGFADSKNYLATNFKIEGNLCTANTSTPFSKSEYDESCAYSTRTSAFDYSMVTSKITTNSSVFGKSSQQCNFNCH